MTQRHCAVCGKACDEWDFAKSPKHGYVRCCYRFPCQLIVCKGEAQLPQSFVSPIVAMAQTQPPLSSPPPPLAECACGDLAVRHGDKCRCGAKWRWQCRDCGRHVGRTARRCSQCSRANAERNRLLRLAKVVVRQPSPVERDALVSGGVTYDGATSFSFGSLPCESWIDRMVRRCYEH